MIEHWKRMARYNRWMNRKLFEVCAQMTDAERKRSRRAPFQSIHGTWNHLLLCDRLWLARFESTPLLYSRLDEEVCSDWDELTSQREATDSEIEIFIQSLAEEKLDSTLRFSLISRPGTHELPMWIAVQHFFNHQTHHRGQITVMIEQAGYDCGVTDLAAMPMDF